MAHPTIYVFVYGVAVGRELFATLPENNRIVKREKERWSLENHRDEAFQERQLINCPDT